MGTVVDLESYAVQLRRRGKRTAPKPRRRNQTTADILIWNGVRIERSAVFASAARDQRSGATDHARP